MDPEQTAVESLDWPHRLIEHLEAGVVYTVKVHGEEWTLKRLGPVLGAKQPNRPWDVVNVVVDRQVVELSVAAPCLMRHT